MVLLFFFFLERLLVFTLFFSSVDGFAFRTGRKIASTVEGLDYVNPIRAATKFIVNLCGVATN